MQHDASAASEVAGFISLCDDVLDISKFFD